MSLQEPEKKMSKSDANPSSYIALLDSPETIIKKFKKAVTDSENEVKFTGEQTGINNLINIYSSVTGKTTAQIETEFEGVGYGKFKMSVAQAVIEHLKPIQEKFSYYISNEDYIKACYEEAKEVLRKNWAFVEKLAAALVERDTLVFEEIAELREGSAA